MHWKSKHAGPAQLALGIGRQCQPSRQGTWLCAAFLGTCPLGRAPRAHMAMLPRDKRAIHSGKTESPLLSLPASPQTSLGLRQFSALQLCQRSLMSAWRDVTSPGTVQLKQCISLLPEEDGEQRKRESSMSHAIPPEGLPAAGKKFPVFLSVLLPQVVAEGNGKVKTSSLGFLDHENEPGPAWERIWRCALQDEF